MVTRADSAAPAASTPATRFVQRLPQFITMFFSFTMVGFFKTFGDTFHFTTGPSIDFHNDSQVLTLIAFVVTLFWIVTAWVGYSILIERRPYTLDLSRFFFDVVRFSLLNFQMDFTFLAAQIGSFQYYIFSVAVWEGLMTGWFMVQAGKSSEVHSQIEARKDALSHGWRSATYCALGILYYFGVANRVGQSGVEVLRCVIAGVTFVMMIAWNAHRMWELTTRTAKGS